MKKNLQKEKREYDEITGRRKNRDYGERLTEKQRKYEENFPNGKRDYDKKSKSKKQNMKNI